MSLALPHGLYYVTRDGRMYLISEDDRPTLGPAETAVLLGVLTTASMALTRTEGVVCGSARLPLADPVEFGDIQDVPFGLYYVTVDGKDMFELTGPVPPYIRLPDVSVVSALVVHVHRVLYRASLER